MEPRPVLHFFLHTYVSMFWIASQFSEVNYVLWKEEREKYVIRYLNCGKKGIESSTHGIRQWYCVYDLTSADVCLQVGAQQLKSPNLL